MSQPTRYALSPAILVVRLGASRQYRAMVQIGGETVAGPPSTDPASAVMGLFSVLGRQGSGDAAIQLAVDVALAGFADPNQMMTALLAAPAQPAPAQAPGSSA